VSHIKITRHQDMPFRSEALLTNHVASA